MTTINQLKVYAHAAYGEYLAALRSARPRRVMITMSAGYDYEPTAKDYERVAAAKKKYDAAKAEYDAAKGGV